jgi:hypothetical protein
MGAAPVPPREPPATTADVRTSRRFAPWVAALGIALAAGGAWLARRQVGFGEIARPTSAPIVEPPVAPTPAPRPLAEAPIPPAVIEPPASPAPVEKTAPVERAAAKRRAARRVRVSDADAPVPAPASAAEPAVKASANGAPIIE